MANSFVHRQLHLVLLFQFQGLYSPLPKPSTLPRTNHTPKTIHTPKTNPTPQNILAPRKTILTRQASPSPRQRSRAASASQVYPTAKSLIYWVSKKPYLPFGLLIIRSRRDPICPRRGLNKSDIEDVLTAPLGLL
jgi:hypothetical protein